MDIPESQDGPVASTSALPIERPLPPPALEKLSSWDLYRSVGSPRFVVAPMVDQSELAWRILSRLHGAELCYTPMIHAAVFNSGPNDRYRKEMFDLESGEEGSADLDRPLFTQFCANDADTFLQAAMRLAASGKMDAIDLNLGCPQGIARRGNYGAFLMEDWPLIERLIHHLHTHLPIPITAKFRVYDDTEKTVAYAQMLERAGAQIITCHGRTRDQKGHKTGLADWRKIRAVKEAVRVPVFANGNVLTHIDIEQCLKETGADGVMSAEGNLYNPALFAPIASTSKVNAYKSSLPINIRNALDAVDAASPEPLDAANPSIAIMCRRYLAIIAALSTTTALSAIKGHLFKLLQPVFAAGKHLELRPMLGQAGTGKGKTVQERVNEYLEVISELEKRVRDDPEAKETEEGKIPYWRLQPYIRPVMSAPVEAASEAESAPVDAPKRAASPTLAPGTRISKMIKLTSCPGSCQPNNVAAADCSEAKCFQCCAAGAGCEAHEKKREKLRLKKERTQKQKQERKDRRALVNVQS